MSTGKRLAKRSILGTRVAAPSGDGLYMTGIIQAVKTCEDPSLANRYSVRFDETSRVTEFLETDLIGPGFNLVASVTLEAGQPVFLTHCQREMAGKVVRHDFDSQDVIITLSDGTEETLLKKIDEVRILESRKSARLQNSDTDFSKLADVCISNEDKVKKNNSSTSFFKSKAIEVPRSDYVQIAGSRKRRTSENLNDVDEEVMTECSAAMLLMKLSCSPQQGGQQPFQPIFGGGGNSLPTFDQFGKPSYPNQSSPVDSSGASSFRSATPSPPLSSSTGTSTADEGIVKDMFTEPPKSSRFNYKPKVVYQCTYPGCRIAAVKSVRAIEAHVRKEHLKRPDDHLDDGEEEFYYTEFEIPSTAPRARAYTEPASQLANFSLLADHLDMCRPAHEDPGFPSKATLAAASGFRNKMRSLSGSTSNKSSLLINHGSQASSFTTPITIAPSVGSPGKYILISPPGESMVSSSAPTSSSMLKSPGHRRIREGKKCRKVYGLEQRDLWCTQCKWKKACARFGKTSPNNNNNNNNNNNTTETTNTSSLLMPVGQQAVRAIKF